MSRYRAWQEGGPNDTPAGGPWFVTVPDGGHIEIGYDASGQPDEFHARLFAAAGNASLGLPIDVEQPRPTREAPHE